MNESDSIPTRASLVARLKDCEDQESWREFFDTYWRLIHATAVRAGLSDSEAQDVVQEVVIAAARKMPGFSYDPAKDSLKGWLLSVTRWKVADQFRNKERNGRFLDSRPLERSRCEDETGRTATVERVPAPEQLSAAWESDWNEHLLRLALERVKASVNPAHYEIYHLHVVQGLSARDTALALSVSTAAVHLAKFRIQQVFKREVAKLGKNFTL